MIQSLWTLTLDPSGTPLTILTAGDMLEDELRFTCSKGLEVVEIENSDSPFLRPRKNAYFRFDFSRRITVSTDIAARAALLDWQITLDDYTKKSLKVMYSGENDYWTFANSFITDVTTWRKVESRLPAYMLKLSITATGITKTVVP